MRGAVASFPMSQCANADSQSRGKFDLTHVKISTSVFHINRCKLMDNRLHAFAFGIPNRLGETSLDTFEKFGHGKLLKGFGDSGLFQGFVGGMP